MTSASSPKTSSGEAEGEGEGVRDSGSGVSGGGVDQGPRSGERGLGSQNLFLARELEELHASWGHSITRDLFL